jgi:hypothetical protein
MLILLEHIPGGHYESEMSYKHGDSSEQYYT